MRKDAIQLEETRVENVHTIEDYPDFHERHRIFPAIFENRQHQRILDSSAGVGCTAQRIQSHYPAELICNDISPTCLRLLRDRGMTTVSFDIDNDEQSFPFPDGRFDAVISLATIEHIIHVDHFVKELHRILCKGGYLYISTPNYASLWYLPRFLLMGKTFHDPLSESARSRYEFYAHVRYFTYRTLLEFVASFGFVPQAVYLPLPESSTRYKALYASSKPKALIYRSAMWLLYTAFSPRWATEPVLCFEKSDGATSRRFRKVVL